MFLFAGQGVMKDGMQSLLVNEYDPKSEYYRMLPAENLIRGLAEEFTNGYMIAFFACSR